MPTNNPYQAVVEGFARLLAEGEALEPAKQIATERQPQQPTHGLLLPL